MKLQKFNRNYLTFVIQKLFDRTKNKIPKIAFFELKNFE